MKSHLFTLVSGILILSSCSKDSTNYIQYPKTFTFHHSTITNEKGYVIGDNESYTEISSKAGNLDTLRSLYVIDFIGFLRSSSAGFYIESFTLLSKDSIRLNVRIDSLIQSHTIPANVENPNGEPIDPVYFDGSTVKYNSSKQEIIVCQTLSAGIINRAGNVIASLDGEFCMSNDITAELKNILARNTYLKNDTLGIYLLDMVYKE